MIAHYLTWWLIFDLVVKVFREDLYVPHGDVNKPKKLKEEYYLDMLKQNN